MVSEGGSDDDDSLDGMDWKEEQVTEQDRMDAEEELPPELRYNGEGKNVCSNLREETVEEYEVLPSRKQPVDEYEVLPSPTQKSQSDA